jgi:perosamine synthetase
VTPKPIHALPLPRLRDFGSPSSQAPFPFKEAGLQWFHLARAGVLHAARRLGWSGGEVLVPAYHHGVEVEALVRAGVRPVFYPIDGRWRAVEGALEALVGPATRGLYVIHYAGFSQPMASLSAFAQAHGLTVIEDCALSLLSRDGTKPLGTSGDASIFCLYKTLPVPHGGLLLTRASERPVRTIGAPPLATLHQLTSGLLGRFETDARLARQVGSKVRGAVRTLRRLGPLPADEHIVGSARFRDGDELLGASAIVKRMSLASDAPEIVTKRRYNYTLLAELLKEVLPPMFLPLPEGVCPLFYPTLVDDKDRLRLALKERGIEAIDFWRTGSPLIRAGQFPEVEALRAQVLELPIHQDLDEADLVRMAGAVRDGLRVRRMRVVAER